LPKGHLLKGMGVGGDIFFGLRRIRSTQGEGLWVKHRKEGILGSPSIDDSGKGKGEFNEEKLLQPGAIKEANHNANIPREA